MIVVAIIGILAAIALPKFWDVSSEAKESAVLSTLHTVREQIRMYDFHNPDTPFNPLVPGGAQAWNQLVVDGFLRAPPKNPCQFDTPSVAVFPGVGVGWVWIDLGQGANLYAVNENGAFFDANEDGTPD
jgi:type II secretory pathway pseudopilin PulG